MVFQKPLTPPLSLSLYIYIYLSIYLSLSSLFHFVRQALNDILSRFRPYVDVDMKPLPVDLIAFLEEPGFLEVGMGACRSKWE